MAKVDRDQNKMCCNVARVWRMDGGYIGEPISAANDNVDYEIRTQLATHFLFVSNIIAQFAFEVDTEVSDIHIMEILVLENGAIAK